MVSNNPSLKPKEQTNVICPVVKVLMVGVTGFEPATPRPPSWCATGLRYTPT